MRPSPCRICRLALSAVGCLMFVATSALAQPRTLTTEEVASLKARLSLDAAAGPDADYRQEIVDVVEIFQRHGALSPSAFRDLSFRYVPLFDSVATDDGSLRGEAAIDRGNHLAYSATVRLRLMKEARLTGGWLLYNSGVPPAGRTDDECNRAGAEALDHGIAYIVAHELAHKELGHTTRAAPTRARNRERELAADWRAFEILHQVHASLPLLRELLSVRASLEKTTDPVAEASSSHPLWSTRVKQLDRFLTLHPPDLRRGGLVSVRRWTGSEIKSDVLFVRGSPPEWMAGVMSDEANESTPRLKIGYAEHDPAGTGLTIWIRKGPALERRHVERIQGEAAGWIRVRTYSWREGQWTLANEAKAFLSGLVSASPSRLRADTVSWFTHDPAADMLSGVADGPRKQRLESLLQVDQEERRRAMKSFCQGGFGLLEFTDRLRLLEVRMEQVAWQQGIGREWEDRAIRLLAAGHDSATGQALGTAGLEMLRRLSGGPKVPVKSYRSTDGGIEFRLPGAVENLDVQPPPGFPPGVRVEAYDSMVDEMPYAVVLLTLANVPSAAERRESLRRGIVGSMQGMRRSGVVTEVDRRSFEIGTTAVLEVAVEIEGAPLLVRLRAMAVGRREVLITSVVGARYEQDVIEGWRVIEP